MADARIVDLTALPGSAPVSSVLFEIVDPTNTTDSSEGSSFKMSVLQLHTTPDFTTSATITGASATAFTVGRLGATTPAFQVDTATALQVAGLKVTGAVTGGTVALTAIDSGADASLSVSAKGAGTIQLNSTTTVTTLTATGGITSTASTNATNPLLTLSNGNAGNLVVNRFLVSNSGSATAFTIDVYGGGHGSKPNQVEIFNRQNATLTLGTNATAAISIDGSQNVTSAKGITITTGGLTVTAGGLTVTAGTTAVQAVTATTIAGTAITGSSFISTGAIVSSSPAVGVGYSTGAGGTVTQITSRTTGVTINKISGTIQTDTSSLADGASAQFTVTNSAVLATDVVIACVASGNLRASTNVSVTGVAAGSFKISVNNWAGAGAETGAIIINFCIIRAVAA